MSKILSVIFLVVNLMPKILLGIQHDKDTLQLVQILFRHGDRNPLVSYPTDPNNLESNWPEGYGQLTNIGKRELYDFGVYLRERYDGYLNKKYFAKDTLVWSSDKDRTIMSAAAALAGLYPPFAGDDADDWNSVANFQIIPIHTIPEKVDRFLNTEREACPYFYTVVKNFIKTSKYMKDLNKEAKNLLKYINTNSGLKITFVNDQVYKFHDTLYVQKLRNMSIPTWAESLMEPDSQFKKIVEKCYDAFSMTPELKRLYSGELLKELINNMKNKVTEKSQLRLVMFSGHDLTITNLMNTMGIYNNEIPPYASTLIVELHKTLESQSPEYTVKIFYRNHTNLEPYVKEVPECGAHCELTKLEELMSSSISQNWEVECHGGQSQVETQINAEKIAENSGFPVLPISLMITLSIASLPTLFYSGFG